MDLDTFALQFKTDKASNCHAYTKIYDNRFRGLKDKPIRFMEIGIKTGASLQMWNSYFSKATIVGIDILPGCRTWESKLQRTKVCIGDQTDRAFLNKVGKDHGPFDIILDDGGHTMLQQQISFMELWRFVKPGGCYIIEDLHTCYAKTHMDSSRTTLSFLKDLVDALMFSTIPRGIASSTEKPAPLSSRSEFETAMINELASVEFHKSLCFLWKR